MKELRLKLLELEKFARDIRYEYDNKYARAHIQEIILHVNMALVQVEYAALAKDREKERD